MPLRDSYLDKPFNPQAQNFQLPQTPIPNQPTPPVQDQSVVSPDKLQVIPGVRGWLDRVLLRGGGLRPGRDNEKINSYTAMIQSGQMPEAQVNALIERNPDAAAMFTQAEASRRQQVQLSQELKQFAKPDGTIDLEGAGQRMLDLGQTELGMKLMIQAQAEKQKATAEARQMMTPFQKELEAFNRMKPTDPGYAMLKAHLAKMDTPPTTAIFGTKGKPPAGFRWSQANPDQLEPIPGGPADTGQSADQVAQAISHYQLPPLSGWVMKTPWGQQVQGKVFNLNPQYDARLYKGGEKVITDISGGKLGQTMKSFNVAIQHTNVFRDAAQALNNGDVKQFNRITQAWAEQTGQPAPTNFDAVKRIWGDEIVKAVVGAAGALGDREDAAKLLSRANSPAQLQGVMDYYLNLMAGQVAGVKKQYEAGSGRTDFNKYLMPETLNALKQHGYDIGESPKTAAPAAVNAKGWKLMQDAQGNKAYVSPDGTQFEEAK